MVCCHPPEPTRILALTITICPRTLVQAAASLSQELGVFDEVRDDASENMDASTAFACRRRQRLRVLLYLYINQIAFKIGYSSMVPQHLTNLPNNTLLRAMPSQSDDQWLGFMSLSVDLTRLTQTSHDLLFSSKTVTRDLILSGGYRRVLDHFRPVLENWWEKYSKLQCTADSLEPHFRRKGFEAYFTMSSSKSTPRSPIHRLPAHDGISVLTCATGRDGKESEPITTRQYPQRGTTFDTGISA